MIAKGTNKIAKAYLGSNAISKAYLGDTLIFPSIPNYLRFVALEASTIGCTLYGNSMVMPNLQYTTDLQIWNDFLVDTTIQLAVNDVVYFKGVNERISISGTEYFRFVMTGAIEAHGNIMSLLYGDNFEGEVTLNYTYTFCRLFFLCASLKTPPELPATTIKQGSYFHMFNSSGITYAPELPATNLNGTQCYGSMFYDCQSMVSAPSILPAISLPNVSNSGTYMSMFYRCISLTNAPELPAATLRQRAYSNMFTRCSKITYIKMLATDISANYCLQNWVSNIASSGIFVKHIDATWNASGASGVPSGWTIIYYNPTTDKYYLSDKITECDDHGNII